MEPTSGANFTPSDFAFIPSDVAVYVGGRNDTISVYALWKDGHLLVIQTTRLADPEIDYGADYNEQLKLDREYLFGLEKIQTLLNTIDFRTNWAYILSQPGGGYRILQKDRPLYRISCPTWAPRVEESEIKITRWLSCEERHGLWNGREVDLHIGWEDSWLQRLECEMKAHRAMLGLGLTFEVLGHIVRGDQVVGIITEPSYGRMVEYEDRALLYDAIAKLQQHNLLYRCICPSNIMISGGKVRLLGLSCIVSYPQHETSLLEKDAEHSHWRGLERLFAELAIGPNFMIPLRSQKNQAIKIIPNIPSPDRSLFAGLSIYYASPVFDWWREYAKSSSKNSTRSRLAKRSLTSLRSVVPVESSLDEPVDQHHAETSERPFGGSILRLKHPRIGLYRPFHPYRRKMMSKNILLGFDDSDRTSDSGCSSR